MGKARTVWDRLSDRARRDAVRTKSPVDGIMFRCIISGKTRARYIEADEGNGWKTVTMVPHNWKLVRVSEQNENET